MRTQQTVSTFVWQAILIYAYFGLFFTVFKAMRLYNGSIQREKISTVVSLYGLLGAVQTWCPVDSQVNSVNFLARFPGTGTSLNIYTDLCFGAEHKFGHPARARALTPEVVGHRARTRGLI